MERTQDLNAAWFAALSKTIERGRVSSPRGRATRELSHQTHVIDMAYPVLTIPERKLSYRFMAAEAYWILSGDNRVAGIAPWNEHIAEFSDDTKTFAGAYGPRIVAQLDYVRAKLLGDPMTRQAALTIWTPNPAPSKDIPCTVAMVFYIRNNHLDLSVFMRSSDIWLGLPYDMFNFSMLAHYVCGLLKTDTAAILAENSDGGIKDLTPGRLSLTAVSSHLYEDNVDAASQILDTYSSADSLPNLQIPTPVAMSICTQYQLRALRDTKPGDVRRWWETKN